MATGFNTRWTGGSWPDTFGGHVAGVVGYSGPTSYVPTIGDPIATSGIVGAGRRVHSILSSLTSDGLYRIEAQPDNALGVPASWNARWFYAGSAAGGGVKFVTITAGGTYTGTTPSVTFGAAPAGGTTATGVAVLNGAGTAVIGVLITNPGAGYLTAPTVTFGAGGATGTATLNAGTVGQEVASGTNLSGSSAILFAIGN